MPPRDTIHYAVRQSLIKAGWAITSDPYVISYGERFLFIDLGAVQRNVGSDRGNAPSSLLIGADKDGRSIAIEVKDFRGNSPIADLEQAIGQYVLYNLLLKQVDPARQLYLAIAQSTFEAIFSEPIGELVIAELSLNLIVVDIENLEVKQWIPSPNNGRS